MDPTSDPKMVGLGRIGLTVWRVASDWEKMIDFSVNWSGLVGLVGRVGQFNGPTPDPKMVG